MSYAQVIENVVVRVGLPLTGVLTQEGFEGYKTSSYNLLPYESLDPNIPSLKLEGWLPLTENKPAYDTNTQYLEFVDYTITETEVIANYVVSYIPEPKLSVEEEIAQLKLANVLLSKTLMATQSAVDFIIMSAPLI